MLAIVETAGLYGRFEWIAIGNLDHHALIDRLSRCRDYDQQQDNGQSEHRPTLRPYGAPSLRE